MINLNSSRILFIYAALVLLFTSCINNDAFFSLRPKFWKLTAAEENWLSSQRKVADCEIEIEKGLTIKDINKVIDSSFFVYLHYKDTIGQEKLLETMFSLGESYAKVRDVPERVRYLTFFVTDKLMMHEYKYTISDQTIVEVEDN